MLGKRTGNDRAPARAPGRLARAAAGVVLVAIATTGTRPAHAGGDRSTRSGTLGQVTTAVREHVEARSTPGGGASTRPGGGGAWYGDYDGYCPTCAPYVAASPVGGPSVRGPVEPVHVSLSLGLQSVEGSDAAVSGAARLRLGGFALAVEGAQYFERVSGAGETITMDIWSMRMAGRVLRLGAGELWVEGGMAGTGSSEFERVTGTVIGASFVHAPGRDLALRGGARYYVFEHDLSATEAHADFGVSFLSVGYRVLAFGVGPALHGPGLGLDVEF